MKIKKPNWTSLEIIQNLDRRDELGIITSSHDDCLCDLCMEFFSLNNFLELFTEDDVAGAIIEYNKIWSAKNL